MGVFGGFNCIVFGGTFFLRLSRCTCTLPCPSFWASHGWYKSWIYMYSACMYVMYMYCLLLPSNQSFFRLTCIFGKRMGVADCKIGQLRKEANSKQILWCIRPCISCTPNYLYLAPYPLYPSSLHSLLSLSLYSVWFNTGRVGLLVGLLGFFLSYVPYMFVPNRYTSLSL